MCCRGVSECTNLIWPNQYWTSRHLGRHRFPGTTHFLWNGGDRIGYVSHLSSSAQSGSGSGWSRASVIGRFQTLLQQVSLAMSGLRSEDTRICGSIIPDLLKWHEQQQYVAECALVIFTTREDHLYSKEPKAFDDVCGKCLPLIKKEWVGIYLLTIFIRFLFFLYYLFCFLCVYLQPRYLHVFI